MRIYKDTNQKQKDCKDRNRIYKPNFNKVDQSWNLQIKLTGNKNNKIKEINKHIENT